MIEHVHILLLQMYFSTVVGINDAGETRQSSDGVTVIRQGLDLNSMTVKDGEAREQVLSYCCTYLTCLV